MEGTSIFRIDVDGVLRGSEEQASRIQIILPYLMFIIGWLK